MRPSPEAGAALAAWHAVHQVVPERLTACLSGIELARMRFPGDTYSYRFFSRRHQKHTPLAPW